MKVEFTLEAERHVSEIDAWWREERRDAPDLFARELAEVLTFAAAMPSASVAYASGGREYRRVSRPQAHGVPAQASACRRYG